jgi:hypothetical protein
MVELADIFRRYGPEYRSQFDEQILPSHRKAVEDIINCRTQQMGGHVYQCENPSCQAHVYSYHSCGNRSCPKCGHDRTEQWLFKQKQLLIPAHYFLVTFTLPSELRPCARSNQKLIYDLLFKSSAAALQKLALDPRFIGGQIGMMGGLHTWRRDMLYHVHVHYIVPGGGLSPDNTQWIPSRDDFLVPVEALSPIFRAKFRDALKKTSLFEKVPGAVWKKDWVVHCKPVGNGHNALKYLAPYVYRVAITNNRIEKLENDAVTFRYKNSDTDQWEAATIPVMEFIRRFLQHVVPKNFMKIRYYGFLASTQRQKLAVIKYILGEVETASAPPDKLDLCCPECGGHLLLIKKIIRQPRAPP